MNRLRNSARLTVVLLPCLAGCLARNPRVYLRTFEPVRSVVTAEAEQASEPLPLRMDRVEAHAHLGTPMLWRLSDVELFFDEANHWARDPASIVDGRIYTALFADGPFVPVEVAGAPSASVRLEAFEGTAREPREARVRISAAVVVPGAGVRRHTFEATEPIAARDPEALARGLGRALDRIADVLRSWLVEAIRAR